MRKLLEKLNETPYIPDFDAEWKEDAYDLLEEIIATAQDMQARLETEPKLKAGDIAELRRNVEELMKLKMV